MNRFQRRHKPKIDCGATHHAINNIREESIIDAFALFMSLSLDELYDEGSEDLPRFAEGVVERFENLDLNEFDFKEYSDMVYEKCGIRITKN